MSHKNFNVIIFSLLLIVWDIDKGDNGIINAGGGDDVDDDVDGDSNIKAKTTNTQWWRWCWSWDDEYDDYLTF